MSTTYVEQQSLTTVTCADCGVLFAMPESWNSHFRKNHKGFFCPAGHNNYYPAESNEERLRKEVAQLQTRIEHRDARVMDLENQRRHLDYQCRAVRGVVTRIKNRVKHGVCPCCNRTFQNLASHMETKHPDYAAKPEVLP